MEGLGLREVVVADLAQRFGRDLLVARTARLHFQPLRHILAGILVVLLESAVNRTLAGIREVMQHVKVLGNQRLTPGGKVKRAKPKQVSVKKRSQT